MRGITALGLVLLVAGAAPALAQTKAELQAIGQQAAAQYGVPWSMFQSQIQGESSWNANIGCNTVNACGIAQFLPGTAQQFGVNTSDPTSSLYGAARYDAQLYQQYGSWTTALTKYSGGLTPSNTAGNASYAQAFTAAQQADSSGVTTASASGSQDFGGGTDPSVTSSTTDPSATTGGVSVADVSIASPDPTNGSAGLILPSGSSSPVASGAISSSGTTTTLTITPGSTQMSHPFAKSYSYVQTLISRIVQTQNQVLSAIQPAINVFATLAIAIMGILMMLGIIGHSDLMLRWLRIILVVGLLANTATYNTYVTQLVLVDVPQWFAGIFNSETITSPADSFDKALSTYESATMNIHVGLWDSIYMGLVEFAGLVIVFLILAVMFVAFMVIQVLSALVLLVAPLLILGLMFEFTRRYVYGLVNALVDLAISALFINILVALITGIITQVIGSIQPGASGWSTVFNLFGAVGTIVILGLLVPISSRIVKGIAGAVATPHVPNPVAPAMAVAAAPVIAATSGPAATAGVITRAVAPVGRSLSLSSKGAR